MSSSPVYEQQHMSSSLPTAQPAPSLPTVEAEQDSVAIDYSVRKSSDDRSRTARQHESRTSTSHELIRLLVANRANIDSNNNNVRMVLDSPSPISRGISPAHTRDSSPAHTRGSSPSLTRVSSPALSAASCRLTENMQSINNNNMHDIQHAVAFNNTVRASSQVTDMTSSHSNNDSFQNKQLSAAAGNSSSSDASGAGDNSLLKALLLKNTDSAASAAVTPTFSAGFRSSSNRQPKQFPLPETKINNASHNILRKRLLGICDDDDEQLEKLAPENPNNSRLDNSTSDKPADDNKCSKMDVGVSTKEHISNDDDGLKDDIKTKNLTEDDYKHRSVLKVLLYRYNTSHHL